MKRCPKCGETKPLEAFPKNRCTKDGLHAICRSCRVVAGKAYHAANSERINSRHAARRQKNPLSDLWRGAHARAKKKRLPFELPHWRDMKVAPTCPLCEKDFVDNNNRDGRRQQPRSRTFDQIIPDLGYTLANVSQICAECNQTKSAFDVRSNTVGFETWAARVVAAQYKALGIKPKQKRK